MANKAKPIDPGRLTRTQLAQLLNGCAYAQQRKIAGARDQVTTTTTMGKWIKECGCPMNTDGKHVNIVEICAWLAVQRKEGGKSGESIASFDDLKRELMKSQIRANESNADYREVKTELEDFKRKIQNGELISADEVERGRVSRARWIREHLEQMTNYAARLHGLDGVAELRRELAEISRETLTMLSEGDAEEEGE